MSRPWLVSTKQDLLGSPAMSRRKALSWARPAGEGHPGGIDQMALLVQHRYVMVVVRPIDASKEHDYLLQGGSSPRSGGLIHGARSTTLYQPWTQEGVPGSAVFR